MGGCKFCRLHDGAIFQLDPLDGLVATSADAGHRRLFLLLAGGEKLIIRQNISGVKPDIKPILTKEEILEARKVVREVYLDEKIERYIVDIVFATRFPQEHGLANLANMISFGASPRASISLALAARAYAFIKRRGYVIPEDIRAVCHDVMRHRIGLSYEAEANNLTSEEVISEILNKVEVP